MKKYSEMTVQELEQERKVLADEYRRYQAMELSLNMARGLPSAEQLDMEADFFGMLYPDSNFISL